MKKTFPVLKKVRALTAVFPAAVSAVCISACMLSGCSFDYGNTKTGEGKPDIVMRDVEYVRVRNGDPVVRFQAEYAERYEERKMMNLENFSFEQFENHGTEINAVGKAGKASVETDSGNLQLTGGVEISVDSEDITIETAELQWKDKEKQLTGPAEDRVDIRKSDGTSFTGTGFTANARERTWVFASGAEGSYVDEQEDEKPSVSDESASSDESAGTNDPAGPDESAGSNGPENPDEQSVGIPE